MGDVWLHKTHTLTPHTPPQESSQKPAAALPVELVTIQHFVSLRFLTTCRKILNIIFF